jgi:hypothetical protein
MGSEGDFEIRFWVLILQTNFYSTNVATQQYQKMERRRDYERGEGVHGEVDRGRKR